MITAKAIKNNFDPKLEIGKEYEVLFIDMGQSYTYVKLKGGLKVNSVQLEFYENGKSLNIYRDIRFNPYLSIEGHLSYKYNISSVTKHHSYDYLFNCFEKEIEHFRRYAKLPKG